MTDVPRLPGVRGVVLDLDGTVYEADRLIAGARETVESIRSAGLPLRFATNTTRRPRSTLVEALSALGIRAEAPDLVTAPRAAAAWLAAHGVRRVALHMSGETAAEFAEFTIEDTSPEAVVVGDLGPGWTFERLNQAFRQLQNGARLMAMQKNRYWLTRGSVTLDMGPFVAALEFATGRNARVIGKPSREFFRLALSHLGLPPHQAVMVGDDWESDIGGAQTVGLRTILVQTGKYQPEDENNLDPRPDSIIEGLGHLTEILA